MKIEGEKHRVEAHNADLSGSVFDDINPSGLRVKQANLAGVSIVGGRREGMTIEGVSVLDMLSCWRAAHEAKSE